MNSDWETVLLGELCTLTKGKSPTLKTPPGDYPLVVTGPEALSSETFQFEGEAVCIPMVSSTGHGHASLKRVHYASGRFAVANIITAAEVNNPAKCDTKFLYYYLQHFKDVLIVTRMQGTANVSLSQKVLSTVPIHLPPMEEQRRLVDLIGSLDDAIEAAQDHRDSLMSAIGQWRDSKIWSSRDQIPLVELCSVDGSLVDPTLSENLTQPHVGTDRIQSGTGDLVNVQTAEEDGVTSGKFPFDVHHVIYSKIRPNLRKVAVPDFSGLCSADAYPLLPADGIPRVYLQQLLLSTPFTEAAASRSGRTKMPKINKTELMSIMVPSHDVNEINTLTDSISALDDARRTAEEHVAYLRTLRGELLSALLSGSHTMPKSYDELMTGRVV